MSTEMVKAILEGRKTQTRRLIKPQPEYREYGQGWFWKKGKMVYGLPNQGAIDDRLLGIWQACPYGQVGDRLWVRETWAVQAHLDNLRPNDISSVALCYYRARKQVSPAEVTRGKWRPSIFMPRWASRITLEITGLRVERLQEISQDDAKSEGLLPQLSRNQSGWRTLIDDFAELWDSMNAKRGSPWESNPWVWVIGLKRA